MIHLITPFSRHDLKETLIREYGKMNVIWHTIAFQDEPMDFNEPWIVPYVIPMNRSDCKANIPQYTMRNYWIQNNEIVDEDYYVTVDDDDMYEPNVFDEIRKMNDDIVVISMKRGNNIPETVKLPRRYPTDTLYAEPNQMQQGCVSSQQLIVKGKIFKTHLFDDTTAFGDGIMAEHHKDDNEQIAYRRDLFALFNYYEPGRYSPRKRLTSIVIPVYNQHEVTADCLKSIVENTEEPYEIIIVDNGSTPPIEEMPIPKQFFVMRNSENMGFPFAVNQGIREGATGDIIVLLNNDVIVTPGWLDNFIRWMDTYDIVGPVTNFCAGYQRRTLPVYLDDKELYAESRKWSKDNYGKSSEANWIIGFCMVFKKELFDEIGIFDASLWPCSGEEIDFCLRAGDAGYKVGIAEDVYVHHHGSMTFKNLEEEGKAEYLGVIRRNDAHLAEKWGDDFWRKQGVAA
jgi:GT2 family glycosyltransferase